MSESSNTFAGDKKLQERIYTAKGSGLNLVQTLKTLGSEFSAAHSLGYRFAERNIKTKYRQSFLGVFWAFLPPLATALIWVVLNKYNVIKLGDVGAPYPSFVITGMMLWSVFSNSLLMPLQTMQANKSILVKINFPRESLIITAFYETLFSALISVLIIALCLILTNVQISIEALFFLPAMFVLILLGLALGLMLLPISMLFKDVQFMLPSILQFVMYLTPVVYSQPIYKGAAKLMTLNPVTPVLTSARSWLLGIDFNFPVFPFYIVVCVSLFLFIIGIFLQRITMQIVIERMGS